MPCSPNDVSIAIPDGPSGPSIPGFGVPFALNVPNINPFPDGFPEDLLGILNTLQLLIPPGALLPSLSLNFGKDIFDAIMKLLDQFMPFLMLYKFFLPILNIIVCIIEVICAIANPFKLVPAIIKLFKECIPAFLLLFPIFAIIIMIISLLLLLIALIEYIIAQILKFIQAILHNVSMLVSAFQEANVNSVLAITKKLGALLCVFQNLFVLLSIFNIIIQIIKDILGMAFAIPPCDDDSDCCTSDVCPAFIKNAPYTNITGKLQYLRGFGVKTDVQIPLPPPADPIFLSYQIRNEAWQIYDPDQTIIQQFMNIVNAFDVPPSGDNPEPFFKPVFFPTDAFYSEKTSPKQAAYTTDLRVFYNPANWGRVGVPRYVRFKDCIVTAIPQPVVTTYNNLPQVVVSGVLNITGGSGYEDDGKSKLTGFDTDGVTPIQARATLNNFLHLADNVSSTPSYAPSDGYLFQDIEYTFKPNMATLLSKEIVTAGCMPDLSFTKGFVNNALAGDVALKTQMLRDIFNGANGISFPNPDVAQQCLSTALSALRSNLTPQGVAEFQTTSILCLQKLRDDTVGALSGIIGIGFDPCKSNFTVEPQTQFTTKPIIVKVNINENNGISLTNGIPVDIARNLAARIKGHVTFGEIGNFTYDGYQSFTAPLTSKVSGTGQIMISFDNNTYCTNDIPNLSHTLQDLDYQFVYVPGQISIPIGDQSDGTQPARDASDLGSMGDVGGKDGS
jgi:hypothetical protein